MLIKEFIQVFRDPRMRIVIFVIPCVQVLVIGYAVTNDVQHVPTAIYDLDNSLESRELTARFIAFGLFRRRSSTGSARQRSRATCSTAATRAWCLRFNHGFADDLRGGRTAALQIIVDGSDSNTAGIVLELRHADRRRLFAADPRPDRVRTGHAGRRQRCRGTARPAQPGRWFNENLESRNFFVPGVIVIVVDPGHAAADQHGRGAREGDRHHRADHGHAHHAHRVHPRQDAALSP